MSKLKHEINEENLADVTGGAVWETADEKWERMAKENLGGFNYYMGKPCPRCEASSNGRYSIYCQKDKYMNYGNPYTSGGYICYNCNHEDWLEEIM